MANDCLVTRLKATVNNSNLPRLKDFLNSVDLGLPSGLRWCKMNLDASKSDGFAESELEYGSYFSWGNIDGHNITGSYTVDGDFSQEIYANTPGAALTENIPANATYDAAKALIGRGWRIPTEEDLNELLANTEAIDAEGNVITSGSRVITYNNVKGILLRSTITGNNNTIFFRACGFVQGTGFGNLKYPEEQGHYYTSRFVSSGSAGKFLFYSTVIQVGTGIGYSGCSIRPVIKLPEL